MSCMYVSPYVCMLSLLLILVPLLLLLLLLFLLLCCCCCTELCKCSSNTCLDERISIETASQVQRHCHNRIYPLVTLCVCCMRLACSLSQMRKYLGHCYECRDTSTLKYTHTQNLMWRGNQLILRPKGGLPLITCVSQT